MFKALLMTVLFSQQAFSLESHFSSSVPEIDTPNTHALTSHVIRGQAPRNLEELKQLKAYGVNKILMFKSQTRKEIDQEVNWLIELGYGLTDYAYIPFPYKDFDGFKLACKQTVAALKYLDENSRAHQKTFFHCTVGEDRTGYLAGLWRVWSDGWTPEEAMGQEMCPRGYAEGNPNKPFQKVVKEIQDDMTPIFAKMAIKLKGQANLDEVDCDLDPSESRQKSIKARVKAISQLRCN